MAAIDGEDEGEVTEQRRRSGLAVRYAREAAKLSQEELARDSGIDIRTIGRIERGKTSPKLETLEPIADRLAIALDALVGRNFAPHPEFGAELPDATLEVFVRLVPHEGVALSLERQRYVQSQVAAAIHSKFELETISANIPVAARHAAESDPDVELDVIELTKRFNTLVRLLAARKDAESELLGLVVKPKGRE